MCWKLFLMGISTDIKAFYIAGCSLCKKSLLIIIKHFCNLLTLLVLFCSMNHSTQLLNHLNFCVFVWRLLSICASSPNKWPSINKFYLSEPKVKNPIKEKKDNRDYYSSTLSSTSWQWPLCVWVKSSPVTK